MTEKSQAFRMSLVHLFGEHYSSSASAALGIHERTIRRFAKGETEPPPGVLLDLLTLVEAKQLALRVLAKALEKAAETEVEGR